MPLFIPSRRNSKRRAIVLIAVLIAISMLALAAYTYNDLTLAEYRAAEGYRRSVQAHALASSGLHYAAMMLADTNAFTNTLNSNPYDNASSFQGYVVQESDVPRQKGRFSLVAPLGPDEASTDANAYRFGVIDEAGKINLNALLKLDSSGQKGHDLLMTLPNMTEDIANAILDWLDPDDSPRLNGAEDNYYQALSPPYHCKNGPLDSLEELLLVKGVTPQLLFGNDRNRNGVVDEDEMDAGTNLDQGLAAYLTIYSHDTNVDNQGNPRIYVNDSDLSTLSGKLSSALGQDLANYIIAYRLYGPAPTTTGAGAGGSAGGARPTTGASPTGGNSQATPRSRGATGSTPSGSSGTGAGAGGGGGAMPLSGGNRNAINTQLMRDRQGTGGSGSSGQRQLTNISSLYDLINSSVNVPQGTSGAAASTSRTPSRSGAVTVTIQAQQTISFPSPLRDQSQQETLLPKLLDLVTTSKDTDAPGRINVNTASQTVLQSLKALDSSLTDNDIQNILGQRPNPSSTTTPDAIFQTPAWLVTRVNLKPATMKSLEKYITTRTQVYRLQSVGYFDKDGPSARIEAVVDTNNGRPRFLMWRDLTELGKGYDLQGQ